MPLLSDVVLAAAADAKLKAIVVRFQAAVSFLMSMGPVDNPIGTTNMKTLAAALVLSTALAVPGLAYAKDLTIAAQIATYRGPNAFLAIYLAKPDGGYDSTLWVAGQNQRYYRHLRNWVRGISAVGGTIDGISGASVGTGQTLSVHASVADAMIDAGYQIHVDSAVENGGEYPNDVVMPLARANSGVAATGTGYVQSLTVTF